jgi:hypothetical protein
MSAAFTPGPWTIDFNRNTGFDGVALTFAIHGGQKSYITSGQSAEHLKTDGQCDDPIMASECEANARLIAAAPELLEALQADAELAQAEKDHDDLCDRACAEGWAHEPTGGSHLTSSSIRLAALRERTESLKASAIAKATGAAS